MRKESLQNAILLNNNFLNFIPLICSFMVVQIHSYNIGNLSKTSISALIISFFSHGLCTTAVPIFFFISGYLFFKNIDTVHDVFKKQKHHRSGFTVYPYNPKLQSNYIKTKSECQFTFSQKSFSHVKFVTITKYYFPQIYKIHKTMLQSY